MIFPVNRVGLLEAPMTAMDFGLNSSASDSTGARSRLVDALPAVVFDALKKDKVFIVDQSQS